MGREIEKILLQRGHEIAGKIDPVNEGADAKELTADRAAQADAAVEFSLGSAVLGNAKIYVDAGIPAVVGTTNWDDVRPRVRELVENGGGSYLWGSNFSVGAHILFDLTERLAAIADKLPDYDILAYELHHKGKKDSPSGTALRIGERILANTGRKTSVMTEKLDRQIEEQELHIASVRGGSIPGTHTVMIDSPADSIEIRHTARNRSGFALGSVLAVEWLAGKQGFYQVEDFIKDFF